MTQAPPDYSSSPNTPQASSRHLSEGVATSSPPPINWATKPRFAGSPKAERLRGIQQGLDKYKRSLTLDGKDVVPAPSTPLSTPAKINSKASTDLFHQDRRAVMQSGSRCSPTQDLTDTFARLSTPSMSTPSSLSTSSMLSLSGLSTPSVSTPSKFKPSVSTPSKLTPSMHGPLSYSSFKSSSMPNPSNPTSGPISPIAKSLSLIVRCPVTLGGLPMTIGSHPTVWTASKLPYSSP